MKKIFKHFKIIVLFLAIVLAVSGCNKKPQSANNNIPSADNKTDSDQTLKEEGADNLPKIHNIDDTASGTKEVLNDTGFKIIEAEKKDCADKLDTPCWNTFVNEKYGYKIKYPNDWDITFYQGYATQIPKGKSIHISPDYGYGVDSFNINDPYYAPLEIVVYDGEIPNSINITKLKENQGVIHNNTKFIVSDKKAGMLYYAIKNDNFAILTTVDGFKDEKKGMKIFETMVLSFEFTR